MVDAGASGRVGVTSGIGHVDVTSGVSSRHEGVTCRFACNGGTCE